MANKFRSVLAVLGISIGTASVVGLLYSGLLASEYSVRQIRAMGTQMLSVTVSHSSKAGFSISQLQDLYMRHKNLASVVPLKYRNTDFKLINSVQVANLLEASSIIAGAMSLKVSGRFLNKSDLPGSMCVLGYNIAESYRKSGIIQLIGKHLYYDYGSCLIIGVLDSVESNFYLPVDINHSVITKISPFASDIKDVLFYFNLGVNVSLDSAYVLADLHSLLPGLQFFDRAPNFLLEHLQKEKNSMTWLLCIIGGISLLVGGIGIMNIMLVSVVERRQEVGIRLAVGARSADIMRMFIFESCILCLCGGSIGLLFGVSLSFVLAFFSGWGYNFYIWPLFFGFIISALVGIFFGYYPALRAARLDPVYCLRGIE